jgi:tRNA threonylcarbamoyladenosine biosynthesis protein TsaE
MINFNKNIKTNSPEETHALGIKIGKLVECGTVIALKGDLGSGKTAFVQGLARGLEVSEDYYITSPTFTIINEYPGRCRLFHVDLYRVNDPEELENIGFNDIVNGSGVTAIEWADLLPENFLHNHLTLRIVRVNDTSREISFFSYGHKLEDLINKIVL